MTAIAVMLTISAIAVTVLMSLQLAQSLGDDAPRTLIVLLLVASPLTVSLMVRDLGRYDTIGILALGFFALSRPSYAWRSQSAALATATLIAVLAVGSEEFELAFLVPVLWLWVGRARRTFLVVVAIPVAVMVASLLMRPSTAVVTAVLGKARAEGVLVTPQGSAVGALSNTLRQQFDYLANVNRGELTLSILLTTGSFLVLAWLLRRHGVFDAVPPGMRWVGLYLILVVVLLGIVGVDYRRWWMHATMTLTAIALISARSAPRLEADLRRSTLTEAWGSLVAALLFIALQAIPVATHTSWQRLRPAWSWNDPRQIVLGAPHAQPTCVLLGDCAG
ncbi:MAG TPA: hypothetical protein VLR26_02165 [Frankiaceae bacterium]|nr:hypothetical protein [Frankiaceae bacterium]